MGRNDETVEDTNKLGHELQDVMFSSSLPERSASLHMSVLERWELFLGKPRSSKSEGTDDGFGKLVSLGSSCYSDLFPIPKLSYSKSVILKGLTLLFEDALLYFAFLSID